MRTIRTVAKIAAVVLVLAALAACAAGPNTMARTPGAEGEVAGFLRGLWHGIIAPITFIISLFTGNVSMYEVHTTGGWYNFGFLLGMSAVFGGGGGATGSRRRG